MSRTRKLAVRVLVSVGLIAALIYLVDMREVLRTLRTASPTLLLVVIGLHTLDRVLMAFKWWLLLEAEKLGIDLGEAIRAYYISSFAGLFLPMTVGADIVRTVTMRGAGRTPVVIATIAVERAIGALSQFGLSGLSLLLLVMLGLGDTAAGGAPGPASGIATTQLAVAIGALVLVLVICLPLSFIAAARVEESWRRRGGFRAKLGELAAAYAGYAEHRGTLWAFLGLTVLEGFLPVTIHFAAARALGLDVPYAIFMATIPIVFLLARLPVSFGGIGVQEGAFVALIGALGTLSDEQALSIAIVFQAMLVVALIPGAIAYLRARGAPADPR